MTAEPSGKGGGSSTTALKPHPSALPNIHAPGEVDRPDMVAFIVSDPATLAGIVVDETSATLEGEWQYSTHTPPYVGLGYIHDLKAGKGKKSVTFTPDLPKTGWYEVRLAHCYNVRRATNTPVTIHHADGEKQLRINQQEEPEHGKLFRTLGVFRFETGLHGWVRISNEGSDEGKVVIADAVQFLPVPAPGEQSSVPNAGRGPASAGLWPAYSKLARCGVCKAKNASRRPQLPGPLQVE
ncbi:xanthan lyase [Roseimicrobium sp. ORNL1]|uniref:golvesin C-terminal-like domain-containing protein n=1 Tax=Roseimicrobium sp. ORNL1 TaxID=2711231 RepID=UPI00197F2DCA|nr:xanthan lyase [Roseimicrobium sp. ORNL1]